MKQVLPLWAASLALLVPPHLPARADEGAAPPALSTRVHADSLPALHAQLKAWLAASLGAGFDAGQAEGSGEGRGEGAVPRMQVDSLGAWGLDKAMLPDMLVREQRRRYERGVWELSLELSAASGTPAQARPAVVRYRVSQLMPVWVMSAEVRKGDALSCQVLQADWRVEGEGKASRLNWQGACDTLQGMHARRPLAPGDVLKSVDLVSAIAILGQREATVVTRQGAIEIQAKGIALADAQVGQRVPVRLNGQDHVVHGVVSAPGVIKVTEGL